MLFGLLVFAAIAAAVFVLAATYNNLVAAVGRATRAWNALDALLRQRHDEIPKLIEFCEPHFKGQRAAFERVLEARAAIMGARQTRAAAVIGSAESALRAELAALIASAQREPALAAHPAFGLLCRRNASLDGEIAEQRARYNQIVARYNAAIARVPGKLVAVLGGFKPLAAFDAETAAATRT